MTARAQTRHLVSINDLTNSEIECLFEIARGYLDELGDRNLKYRIARGKPLAQDFILATLFFEPSTRTRLSFESAMLRLGGSIITSADPATSSAAKGESLADSVRVVSNYADLLVIRHPRDGAARLAAEFATVPVINGGDGSHEHPTQTLCDLFTLKQKHRTIKNLKVAISGDLKGSRTIHSFVYALARFGATIEPLPAPGMALPAHVDRRLREEFRSEIVAQPLQEGKSIDALYVTSNEPHQQSLFSGPEIDYARGIIEKKIDAVYVTRFQKERWAGKDVAYPTIDADFLRNEKYSEASVMHPLPRVGELDASVDSDSRAIYFQQAAYGVPVRMALISLLLGLHEGKSLRRFRSGFQKERLPVYDQPLSVGIRCGNRNCIVHETTEAQYVRNRFHVIKSAGHPCLLRCAYCEADVDEFVTANKRQSWYSPDRNLLTGFEEHSWKDMLAFASEQDALDAGFHLKRNRPSAARKSSTAS